MKKKSTVKYELPSILIRNHNTVHFFRKSFNNVHFFFRNFAYSYNEYTKPIYLNLVFHTKIEKQKITKTRFTGKKMHKYVKRYKKNHTL